MALVLFLLVEEKNVVVNTEQEGIRNQINLALEEDTIKL
jgi:hypothetical protein